MEAYEFHFSVCECVSGFVHIIRNILNSLLNM